MHAIETPRLTLRPFEDSDFEAVHEYASDPSVTRFQTWGPNSEADTRGFIQRSREALRSADPGELQFAIVERSLQRLVGGCGLMARRVEYREYELGYSLNPRYWRQGIGSEAVLHLLGFAFDAIGAHRVFAYIDPLNEASIRLAEKAGLRREGCLLRDVCIHGTWHDTLVYAVLDEEFQRARRVR